jgi:hypothetical protein
MLKNIKAFLKARKWVKTQLHLIDDEDGAAVIRNMKRNPTPLITLLAAISVFYHEYIEDIVMIDGAPTISKEE